MASQTGQGTDRNRGSIGSWPHVWKSKQLPQAWVGKMEDAVQIPSEHHSSGRMFQVLTGHSGCFVVNRTAELCL